MDEQKSMHFSGLTYLREDIQCLSNAFAFPAHVTRHKDTRITTLDVHSSAWLFPNTFSIALFIHELVPARNDWHGLEVNTGSHQELSTFLRLID